MISRLAMFTENPNEKLSKDDDYYYKIEVAIKVGVDERNRIIPSFNGLP